MEFIWKWTKTRLVLASFLFWNNGSNGNLKSEINLPGEPLTPRDFQNAHEILPRQMEYVPDCEVRRYESSGMERSKDQRTFATWENGNVPYLIDFRFGLAERAVIAGAITRLRRVSCINFISKVFHEDFVFIAKRSRRCGSYVGRIGGEQLVTLNDECMTEGSILHELLHVIGFEHEQCRIDRDKHIRISFYNISQAGKHNFFKIQPPRVNYAGSYDLTSISHYSPFAFARATGLQTIFPNDKVNGTDMGQRERLSEVDIFKINQFYNCSTVILQKHRNGFFYTYASDLHHNCKEFVRFGACQRLATAGWMSINCRVSCPPNSDDSECRDYNSRCATWATSGECEDAENEDYMRIYCSKACNLCVNQTHS